MSAEAAETVLANKTLRWSSPILFDDPLDVARVWGLGFSIDDLEAALIREFDYIYETKDASHINHHPVFRSLTEFLLHKAPQEEVDQHRAEAPALLRQGIINSKP